MIRPHITQMHIIRPHITQKINSYSHTKPLRDNIALFFTQEEYDTSSCLVLSCQVDSDTKEISKLLGPTLKVKGVTPCNGSNFETWASLQEFVV